MVTLWPLEELGELRVGGEDVGPEEEVERVSGLVPCSLH